MPVSAAERFDVLKAGKIDLLARNSTWTMSRETQYGLTFVGTSYYDGQGFLVNRSANLDSALELGGLKICVQSGTTTEANLADYFAANRMDYTAVPAASPDEAIAAYGAKKCDVMTSDVSQLYALREKLPDADEHVILPEVISKEPLGPVVRQDDPKWATVVKWVHFALLDAEELGVGSDTLEEALASTEAAGPPAGRCRWDLRRGSRSRQSMGRADHPCRRKLRRDLRAQPRHPVAARHPARPEPALESRRHSICAVDPVGEHDRNDSFSQRSHMHNSR